MTVVDRGTLLPRSSISRRALVSIALLGALVVQLLAFEILLPADRFVQQWLRLHSSEAVKLATEWVEPVVTISLITVLLMTVGSRGWRRPRNLLEAALVIGSGAALSELLKTVFERLRPNPFIATANSFPSGHIMNTTIAVVAILLLARHVGWHRRACGALAAVGVVCLSSTIAARLLRESHWLSDVLPSLTIGLAWALVTPRAFHWMGRRGVAVTVAVYIACYTFFWAVPEARVSFASARDPAAVAAVVPSQAKPSPHLSKSR